MSTIIRATRHNQSAALGCTRVVRPILQGLQAYYRFEETGWDGTANELQDISSKGNHGVMGGGGSVNSVSGKLGKCFPCNGTNYFSIPLGVFNATEGTWLMWVYADGAAANNEVRLFNSDDSEADRFRTFNNPVNTSMAWTPENDAGVFENVLINSDPIADASWHLLGAKWQYDGTAETSFWGLLNGTTRLTNGTLANTIEAPDIAIYIGGGYWREQPAPWKIGEFMLWDRLLTEDEFEYIYNAGRGIALV